MKIFNIRVKKLANLFGIIWLGSLVAFFGLGYVGSQPENILGTDLLRTLFITIILTGVFSFALAVVFYFLHFVNKEQKQVKKNRKKKNNDFANIKHRALVSSVVGLSIIGILLLVALLAKGTGIISGASMEQTPTPSIEAIDTPVVESPTPIYVPPTAAPTIYVDPDPIVNCGPGQNSGQYVKDRRSNCINYVDCGFANNVWTLMLKSECDEKHAEANPSCTIYYPSLGYSKTYNMSPEDCKYYQGLASNEANTGNANVIPPPIQQPTIDYAAQNQANIQLQSQCKADSANYYQQQEAAVRSNRTLGDSSKQIDLNNLSNQANQAAQACESKYPTN